MCGKDRRTLTVGFLPVTCHLTCPVTSWVTRHSGRGSLFRSQKFMDFPTMKEAFVSRELEAAFMNVPLAMKLAMDGVPAKIVYLGHRDGTVLMVRKDAPYRSFSDLAGKTVAVPGRFSNQAILLFRMLEQNGMPRDALRMPEMAPPDMPSALAAGAIDGYIVGEPHGARSELGTRDAPGWGRVLLYAKDMWPKFISCGLVVRQELIDRNPQLVKELVTGIARSGQWLDQDVAAGAQHRRDAAVIAGRVYYNQDPALLEYVLTRPRDRVTYTDLKPVRQDFEEIMSLGLKYGVLDRRLAFEAYVDDRFAPDLGAGTVLADRLPIPAEAPTAPASGAEEGRR
jgi:NitT/TauT family transport system substrate-binding protein